MSWVGIIPFYEFFVEEEEVFKEIIIEPSWIGWIKGEKPKSVRVPKPKDKNWIQKLFSWDEKEVNPSKSSNIHGSIDAAGVAQRLDFSIWFNILLTILVFLAVCFTAMIIYKCVKRLLVFMAHWISDKQEDQLEVDMMEYQKYVIESLVKKQMKSYKKDVMERLTGKQCQQQEKEKYLMQGYHKYMDKFTTKLNSLEQVTRENPEENDRLRMNIIRLMSDK